MAKYRVHSIEFKRQVAAEYAALEKRPAMLWLKLIPSLAFANGAAPILYSRWAAQPP